MELKDKLGAISSSDDTVVQSVSASMAKKGNVSEAMEALVALGYGQSEAAAVLANSDESRSVEELIKMALKKLARF